MHLAATHLSLPLEGGMFDCPHCRARRRFVRKQEQPFMTVCFVPLVPYGEGIDFVECLACGGVFDETATGPREQTEQEDLAERILRLMVLVMIRDGKAEAAELDAIQSFGAATLGRPIPPADIWADIRAAQLLQADAFSYADHLRGLLSPRQRQLASSAAALVVGAGGETSARDAEFLAQLRARLSGAPSAKAGSRLLAAS
jgi:hypothetical protein